MNGLEKLLANPRITVRRKGEPDHSGRAVIYWMQRAQRGIDNPALDVAIEAANEIGRPLAVFFGLHPRYPSANLRHYSFLIEGIEETARVIEGRGAAFIFRPYPDHSLIRFCEETRPCLVIGDENPLRAPASWRQSAAQQLKVPFWTVDADLAVPSRLFEKEEYAARTFRPKITPLIDPFLQPSLNPLARCGWPEKPASRTIERDRLLDELPLDRSAGPVSHFKGGTSEGTRRLQSFIKERLAYYNEDRNRPEIRGTSKLSAYLHFGHISPITVALAVREADAPQAARDAFLEELIVRRELAINFVVHNPEYDKLKACPEWAQKTLAEHAADPRSYLYTEAQLESAETHDPLWNAAQIEMMATGWMHGYMRMYWAKKILEWTESPAMAFDIAVKLNDRYELDGRDPNGYTGIAWAIGGKHDRAWGPRRPVFGTIRYMSAAGAARKFDVESYVRQVNEVKSK